MQKTVQGMKMSITLKDSTDDTTLGAALKQILTDINHVKSASEMSDRLLQDLKAVATKVDDHDKSIILVAKAMEDINKNMTSFTDTIKDMQRESNTFQRENQKIMMKLEQVLEGMAKTEPRLLRLEDKQITGCSSFLNFKAQRDSELKHWEDVKHTLITATSKNRGEIDELTRGMAVLVEQKSVANKRIGDLEKFEENFGTWKENIYKALIANGVALLGAIATMMWKM